MKLTSHVVVENPEKSLFLLKLIHFVGTNSLHDNECAPMTYVCNNAHL